MKPYKSYFIGINLKQPLFLIALCLSIFSGQLLAQTDYGDIQNWAAHPWKHDPSDSLPKALQANYALDSSVDVFFIHPTSYIQKTFDQWNASLQDSLLNKKTDESSILYQASVFNASCRVFAPRYRQANLKAFYLDSLTAKPYFDTAYADIQTAFQYYLEHFNGGRPIIIASHSQGTLHAARLLKAFFDGQNLNNKLVCAYLIGLPVPINYFTHIKPCTNEFATGCFVSWRTYKDGYIPERVSQESFKAVVVNPLTWTMGDSIASADLNKGAILRNFNKIVPHAVNAQVHGNVLWSSKPDVPGKIFFTQKNYHIGDINLFYMNIRENVATRIRLFWK
jgi:hypothetical protein